MNLQVCNLALFIHKLCIVESGTAGISHSKACTCEFEARLRGASFPLIQSYLIEILVGHLQKKVWSRNKQIGLVVV